MNRYPMKAHVEEKTVRNLRLVADDSTVTVWAWDPDAHTGRVVVAAAGPPERVGATTSWTVGDLVLEEQRGCGCSHPMYTWVPDQVGEERSV